MRGRSWMAVMALPILLTTALPAAAAASDGALGARSSGTVTIRVSVAPRAWAAGEQTLCVAAPPGGYSLREASGLKLQPPSASAGDCHGLGRAATIPATLRRTGQTLLIVAE